MGNATSKSAKTCEVPSCDRTSHFNGKRYGRYCSGHKSRWSKFKDVFPDVPLGKLGHLSHTGDVVSYQSAHQRLRNARGPASDYQCAKCEKPALQWSYSHGSPKELNGESEVNGTVVHLEWSPDPSDYEPLCRPCHKGKDDAYRRGETA